MPDKIGVLALQGAFARHADVLRSLGAEPAEVRTPAQLVNVDALVLPGGESTTTVTAQVVVDGEHRTVTGTGGGPISAFVRGLRDSFGVALDVVDYAEHALSAGGDAVAAAYVECAVTTGSGETAVVWGVGIDANIVTASFKAVVSAVNRAART